MLMRSILSSLAALAMMSGVALAQSKVIVSVGGAACLCYLPTMLAQELGEYKRPASMSNSSTSRAARNRSPR